MTTIEFLSKLRKLGVEVQVEGERLRLHAPQGVLSQSLKEEIANRKEEILSFLNAANTKVAADQSGIPLHPRHGHLPLSYSQERLWFLEQLSPGNYAYNMPGAIRLKGHFNLTCFEQALNEILARHEVLRTNFTTVDDQPIQVISPPRPLPFTIRDLSHLPPDERLTEAKRITEEEARRPFDLQSDLLIRASLLKLNDEEHIFVLNMHHIVSDGWSISVFAREFTTLYSALVNGQASPLAALPIQYADFACWQREWLQGERLASQLDYWKRQLGGELPQLELLLDKPRPPVQSLHSARVIRPLPAALSQALKRLSQEEGATLFMTLLAAFKLLLHRYTGLEDIIVGTPIAGRNRTEVENLIGFFINTLVLRTDLSDNPTFRELIQRLKKTATDAYTHQDIPFEKLLIELHPERNLSRTPLFQVFFNMLNFEGIRAELPGLRAEVFETPDIGSKFDLTLYVIEQDNIIGLNLVYNTDLFTSSRIEELLSQFEFLLAQIVATPNAKITNYSLVDEQAKNILPDPAQKLVPSWREAVHCTFSHQAGRVPNQIALRDQLGSWTYQELDHLSNQLANYLRAHNVQSQDVVAIYGHRSASLIWAVLGVLKAGAVFVVLDPAYPPQRLIDCLKIAEPQGWLQLEGAGPLPKSLQEFVDSSSYDCHLRLSTTKTQADTLLREYQSVPSQETVGPDDLAYVAFTSGSTGRPKGILGSHGPLAHFIQWHIDTFGLQETDYFSMLSGLAHDPLLRDIFTPLCLGATLCIPDQYQMLSPGQLLAWMEEQQISVAHLTPALQQVLVTSPSNDTPGKLLKLRYAFFGGEPLTRQHVLGLKELAPEVTCVNFYGATETPQAMSYSIVDTTQPREIIPLGRGIEAVQLLVLNSSGQLAGLWEVGEIYIRTPYLSVGYLQDDSLTQERFLINPFTKDTDDRMYRTSDLGRYLSSGEVEFLGRNDDQVKIRGFRIELGEIEVALHQHPAVQRAVASTWEAEHGDKRLIAYILLHPSHSLQPSELRSFLKTKLPDYMIPASFMTLDKIPLTPNGKVNRKALPAPDFGADPQKSFIAPQTDTEKTIAQIWAEVLKLQRVGVHDNFFELGGHSILATQVASRIRKIFQIDVPLRDLFMASTVAQSAKLIDSVSREGSALVEPIPTYPREGNLPLSYSQERLWFLEQLTPGNYAYNMPGAIRLKGHLNLPAFEQALNEILARHEGLRTNFLTHNDQPFQLISPPKPLPFSLIDLTSLPPEHQLLEAKRLTEAEAQRPFDLSQDLLVRASLLKLSQDDHIFLLTIHHIVSDGWSRSIFTREFITLYEAFTAGRPNPLPPLPIQYADFACWQREWLQGERLASQLDYWKRQLGGELPQLELLLDKPRPPVQSLHSARVIRPLPAALSQALKRLSQEEGATLFMTLLAAFKLLLHRYTGLEDIIVGTPIAGRNRTEVENLIGFFINTLVLRTDLSDNPTFRELIQRLKKTATDAYTHQDIPFEKLLIELHPERNLSRTPLFQVFFNMLNFEGIRAELPGLRAEVFETPDIGSKFDLTLYVIEKGDQIGFSLIYNTDLFTPERIDTILAQYEFLLTQIAESANKRLDTYSLATSEKANLLPDPTVPLDSTWHNAVHAQFSSNAQKHPTNIAIVDKDGQWLYAELEQRTNQLSHFLRANGLESQQVVAVYGHRSAALVWAILGILKAGGAFLILDPAYPVARLLDYLNIANPRGLIQLEAAGPLPSALELWASGLETCRITLPDGPSSIHAKVLDSYAVSNPDLSVGPDDLACISFTSGSTGKPKGVMGRHGPLSHFIPWQREVFQLSAADHFSMLSGLSHDPLQRDIFTALWVGASVHIPDPENIGTPGWLNEWMHQQQITFSHFTPAMAQLLAGSTSGENQSEKKLPALRYAFFVGDKLTQHDVGQLGRLAPNVICINSYGSTETQRAVGYLLVDPKEFSQVDEGRAESKAVIPVGRGMKDVQLLVLTSTRQLAGIGELGEIYVRSPHLAKGYLSDESLTKERFIANPFTNTPGDRLYKSGDLGRYLPDGKVEFLGRKDKQVKIRGFRIELGEIETILSKHPAVHQTVVTAWETDHGDKRLVAYVVLTNQNSQKSVDLRDFLQERLPVHMVPSHFVFLPAIPITPNGKINHSELPPPTQNQPEKNHIQVGARDNTEEVLVKIWEELLQVRPIGVKDNFFELGGHSLLAVHLFAQIKKKFGVNLPLATLFQKATVEHLADLIKHEANPATWSSLIGIETQGHHPPFFCIHGITGDILWFRDLAKCLAPNYPFYGLQARGLDGIQNPISQIDEMAARYIEEIRALQPNGPYLLGGASFGGTVALEIAQQLWQQGEKIALLAIFDHSPPNIKVDIDYKSLKNRLVTGGKLIQNFPYWLKEFLQLGPSRMLMRLRRKMRLAKKAGGQPGVGDFQQVDATDIIDFAPALPSYRQQLITSHYQAMKTYIPKAIPEPGQVTLFRAKSRPLLNMFDPEVGWQKLAPGRVNVVDVPSSHEGMFRKPHVNHLAQALKSCIDRASDEMQHFQTDDFQSRFSAKLLYLLFPIIVMPLIM